MRVVIHLATCYEITLIKDKNILSRPDCLVLAVGTNFAVSLLASLTERPLHTVPVNCPTAKVMGVFR